MNKRVKRALGAGALATVGYAAWRAWKARVPDRSGDLDWASAPFPFPPVPRPPAPLASKPAERAPQDWVEPLDDGGCPVTHPIKGKLTSGIYHVPGGANYERTQPDRCYVSEDAAQRDGLRRAKA